MIVVLDTNTVLSGLIWNGSPRLVLDAARAEFITIYTSPALLKELQGVLLRPKFAPLLAQAQTTADTLFVSYQLLVTIIDALPLSNPISRDPDDDAVLACAQAARAVAIISGDQDLLELHVFQGIPILTAAALLERLARERSS
jgi:uncharacterized protein